MRKALFEILQISIGTRDSFSVLLLPEEWNCLLELLKRQALLGIGFDAICQLPLEPGLKIS